MTHSTSENISLVMASGADSDIVNIDMQTFSSVYITSFVSYLCDFLFFVVILLCLFPSLLENEYSRLLRGL